MNCTSKLLPIAAALYLAAAGHAGSWGSDFTDIYPPGLWWTGTAVVEEGHLVLTKSVASQQGTAILEDFDAGATIEAFTATFKLRMGGGDPIPADGFCFYFGNDVDIYASFGEEGPDPSTSGIAVCFDLWNNGTVSNPEAPAIDIKVNGVTVHHSLQELGLMMSDAYADVSIALKKNGTLSVTFKGQPIYQDAYLDGYSPITGGLFAFGARTGDSTANHWMDDLNITTTVAGAAAGPTITKHPQNATVDEYGTATFSVALEGTPPFTFEWSKNGAVILGAGRSFYTVSNASYGDNNAKYKVKITNAQGYIESSEATLTVNRDTVAPTLAGARSSAGFNTVTVQFSEPVTAASAQNKDNYDLSGSLTIDSATLVTPNTVRLVTSRQAEATQYTLTVSGVQDPAFIPNTIAANSPITFSSWVFAPGFLKHEYYATIESTTVDGFMGEARYLAGTPTETRYMTAFDSRTVFPDDTHEGFGAVMSGVVIGPDPGGAFNFFTRSDDPSRLYFNPAGENPDGVIQIAEEAGCCQAFLEPGVAQTSDGYELTPGQRYAVMFVHVEITGGDYAQVAWRKEGETTPAAGSLTPIPGSALGVYVDPAAVSIQFTTQPQDVATTENKTATFIAVVSATPAPAFYQWQRAEPGSATFANIDGATAASYTTPVLKQALDDGAKYRVVVTVPGGSKTSAEAALSVSVDNVAPTIASVTSGRNMKSLYVTFTENVDPASAGVPDNYTIPGLDVTGVTVTGPNKVRIDTSVQVDNTPYTVAVNGVLDTAIPPNPIGPPDNLGTFVSLVRLIGLSTFEAYTGLGSGTAVADLKSSAKYPDNPDATLILPGFEGPVNYTDAYGVRLSGFFTPITSGNYTFYMSTDDNGELWVSTDSTPEHLQLVATEPGYGGSREWTGNAEGRRPGCDAGDCENISAPIGLEAGKDYYIELLYKEGGGGDNGGVKAVLAGQSVPTNGDPPLNGSELWTAVDAAVLNAISLPIEAASAPGSGNTPGFVARIYQSDQGTKTTALVNTSSRAETQLAGDLTYINWMGSATTENCADLWTAVDGVFPIAGVINLADPAGAVGSFPTDAAVPGIPGLGDATHYTDNFSGEVITYVEFPAAGVYAMAVNSDDGFKVTATDTPPAHYSALEITEPAASRRSFYSTAMILNPPVTPVTAKLVYADPPVACKAGSTAAECAITLNNADAIRGNIALCDRGVGRFDGKAISCLQAGALACIIANNADASSGPGIWPIGNYGGEAVGLMTFMISRLDGDTLKALLPNVTVTIAPDDTPVVGVHEGDSAGTAVPFSFYVPMAGVYPLRAIWYEGGGTAAVELFSIAADGTPVLVNDLSNPKALKAFQKRTMTAPVAPTLNVTPDGANVRVEWAGGVLQRAWSVNGPWSDDPMAISPKIIPVGGAGETYWRARR